MGEADAIADDDTWWQYDDAWWHDEEPQKCDSHAWGHDDSWLAGPDSQMGESHAWYDDDSSWGADPADAGDASGKYTPEHQDSADSAATPVPSNVADIMKTSIESGSSVTYTQQADGVVTLVVKPPESHVPKTVHSNRWAASKGTQWHANKLARAKAHHEAQQSGCISKARRITSVTMCANCDMRQPSTRCPQVMCTPCCLEMMKGGCDFAGHKFN